MKHKRNTIILPQKYRQFHSNFTNHSFVILSQVYIDLSIQQKIQNCTIYAEIS